MLRNAKYTYAITVSYKTEAHSERIMASLIVKTKKKYKFCVDTVIKDLATSLGAKHLVITNDTYLGRRP